MVAFSGVQRKGGVMKQKEILAVAVMVALYMSGILFFIGSSDTGTELTTNELDKLCIGFFLISFAFVEVILNVCNLVRESLGYLADWFHRRP